MSKRAAGVWLPMLVAAAALTSAVAASGHDTRSSARAFAGAGRWITYPDGRVFIPHGFNTVVTKAPFYNARLGEDDARLLAEEGFTTIRMLFLPSALEAGLGHLDTGYLQRFVDQVRLLARYGITTVVGLEQLRYAEACGGDGFPSWAVLVPCFGDRSSGPSPAWAPFWANATVAGGTTLQEHYLRWWQAAARALAPLPSLLGYDALNEPWSPSPESLGDLMSRTAASIHEVDRGRLVLVEPADPSWPRFGGRLTGGLGFTGHVYCQATLLEAFVGRSPGGPVIDRCIRQNAATLAAQVAYAKGAGSPLLVGEFGASDELREQRALVDAMGRMFVPWQAYAWSTALDSTGTPSQAVLRDEAKPASQANAKQAKLDVLSVPYPMAVAGTPRTWAFDRKTRVVRFAYSTRRVGGGVFRGRLRTVVFVPRRVYRKGYVVRAVGARVVSRPTSPWLELVAHMGVKTVHVRIAPNAFSATLSPLQVDRCGYDVGRCG